MTYYYLVAAYLVGRASKALMVGKKKFQVNDEVNHHFINPIATGILTKNIVTPAQFDCDCFIHMCVL